MWLVALHTILSMFVLSSLLAALMVASLASRTTASSRPLCHVRLSRLRSRFPAD